MTLTATSRPLQTLRLHGFALSGHSHRVELFLSLLGLPFERIDVDIPARRQRAPEFLALNPFGQVPVLEDGDVCLADSNAILVYLAARYAPARWWPQGDALQLARIQRWLSVAAGELAHGPGMARVAALFNRPPVPEAVTRAHALFALIEQQLQRQDFLAGSEASLADLANYGYTAHAPEGGVSLAAYPRLRGWLERIEALPGFVGMPRSDTAAARAL